MTNSRYARPLPPDMLPDGTPQRTVLRTSRAVQVDTKEPITQPPRPVPHNDGLLPRIGRNLLKRWYLLGSGALLLLGLYIGYMRVALPLFTNLSLQWHYGDARIVQLDANVGHGGTSHFLAQWYHGYILLVEISENNPHLIHAYKLEPFTTNEGAITLTVADVNHDDKPDLLIQIEGEQIALVLYNTGTAFTESEV
jgi:hypothetical protein